MRARTRRFTAALNLLPFALLIIPVFGPPCAAQIVAASSDQAPAVPSGNHPLIGTATEQVNPANGQIEVSIPVPVPGGRGPQLHFAIDYGSGSAAHLIWNAGLPTPALAWVDNASVIGAAGWSYALPLLTYNYRTLDYTGQGGKIDTCYVLTDFMLRNVDGDQQLGISPVQESSSGTLCPNVPPGTPGPPIPAAYLTGHNDIVQSVSQPCSDGICELAGNMVMAPPLAVADAGGTVYSFSQIAPGSEPWDETMLPTTIEDRNGNQLAFESLSAGAISVWDEEKRTALATSGFGSSGNTITVSGLSSPYTIDWTTWSPTGYTVSAQYDPNNPSGDCQAVPADTSTVSGISSITLPNGQSYQFQYSKGLLSKIIFPTGGYVRYVWGNGPVWDSVAYPLSQGGFGTCVARYSEPVVTNRYVSFNGSSEVLEQDFSYGNPTWGSYWGDWATRQTTVTTKDLVTGASRITVYNYIGFSLGAQPNDPTTAGSGEVTMETSILHEGGSGTVLETDARSGAFDLPPSQTITLGPAGGGETRETERDYANSPCNLPVLGDVKNYDYGSNSPGPILNQTVYAYAGFADTPMFPSGPSICGLPSSVVTEDASGSRVAETDYTYDQTTPASVPGLYGKDYSSGNYGNVTTESRWVNTTNSFLNTAYTYDQAGQLLTVTNPLDAALGKTTETISYADSYAGGNPATPTDAYPTTITDALGHTRQYSWNYASGEMASSTDENGNVTTYTYSDPLARLTEVNYPDGGETTYAYNDTPPSPSVTTSREISSGNWLTTVSVMDGMGHVVETETTSDGAGTDYVATTYTGLGRVYTAINPYRSTSDPTYGLTTYGYDALGRTVSVTHPDGSVLATAYTGRATEVTDEGNGSYNVTRISQADGLGRLVALCEVTSQNGAGSDSAPSSCNAQLSAITWPTGDTAPQLDEDATGFATGYLYGPLGNLLDVYQPGLDNRSFTYDSLSRLTAADDPESGLIKYNYDTADCGAVAAPGELTCRTDARGVTTAYTYDADSRILAKTFSDGTPQIQLVYDEPSPWGVTLQNPAGRLVLAQTLVGGVTNTGETFSYDSMGRVAASQQCVPLDCGSGSYTLSYNHDFLGDVTSATNGAGVTLIYGYNNARQLTSVASSLSGADHPGTLFSAPSYDAGGQLMGFEYGNGQTETDIYNNRMELTSRSVTGVSSPATGSITLSGSEQSKNGTPATAGSGSVGISGGEQSIAATAGHASITITGSEQSGSTSATHATGSVSISGSEQDYNYCYNAGPGGQQCQEIYQGGGVYVTLDGATESGDYDQGSTDDSVASALAAAFNGQGLVTATESNGTVYFTSVATGSAANYSMSTYNQFSTEYWSSPSFTGYLSGASLTGGKDASTYYDSGTVSITINGQTFSASYGQGSTTASVASALASAVSSGSAYASASASGATISLAAKTTGSGTNYSLSASSATGDPSQFSSPSFGASSSGSAFTGGQNIIYDSGTVTITVNGFAESVSYGNGSTPSSLASALASGFSGAGGSPVSATASGGAVDLTSKTTGSSTNYSLSASSATGDSGQFSSPSFSTAPSGPALTGGTAGTATIYDAGTVWAQVGSFKATVNYGQSDTASSIAANLASALSASGSPVTATASGAAISLTTSATGGGADLPLSTGSATSDGGDFSSPSFSGSPSGSALTGGGTGSYSVTGIGYAPDGDVTGDNDSVNGQWQYEYGPLNRLLKACSPNCTSPTTAAGYAYDRFGNRWEQNNLAGGVPAPQLTFNGNNQIVGASYDASGDLLEDSAGNTYTYNAQHRIASADSNNIQYVYNALGQRVEKIVGGAAKYYLYDPAGHAVTVLDGSGNWVRGEVFAGSRHIATYVNGTGGTTYFDYSDWLGTERLTATVNGDEQDACTSLPYGDDFNCAGPGADPSPLHFTGEQHDNETGLDHFSARNYTSTWGLWLTPDWSASPTAVPYASFSDPQSLDLYGYTLDNPETNTDPDGHWCFIGIGTTCAHKKVKGGPKVAGPGWMTRCEGNSLCAGAILAGLVQAALAVQQARQLGQSFKEHPYLNGALLGLSLFVGPEAEEAGAAAEEAAGSAEAPGQARAALDAVDRTGEAPPGAQGGDPFQNREGVLPRTDPSGKAVTYREWDIKPANGGPRGTERLVTGSDGSAYYTADHYQSFVKIR